MINIENFIFFDCSTSRVFNSEVDSQLSIPKIEKCCWRTSYLLDTSTSLMTITRVILVDKKKLDKICFRRLSIEKIVGKINIYGLNKVSYIVMRTHSLNCHNYNSEQCFAKCVTFHRLTHYFLFLYIFSHKKVKRNLISWHRMHAT